MPPSKQTVNTAGSRSYCRQGLTLLGLCLLVSACGGGGGGGSDNDTNSNGSASGLAGFPDGFSVTVSDAPGTGFNDPTPAAPVGGNTADSVGAQRLAVISEATRIWAAVLDIRVDVALDISFEALECDNTSAVVGVASPVSVFRNFRGAPKNDTWYVSALANTLAGVDLGPDERDIEAVFNGSLGTPGCLGGANFYYGFDRNAGFNQIDLLHIVLHELGHGLGFISLIDINTGGLLNGFNDTFTDNLRDAGFVPYSALSNSQRQAAITSQTVWGGAAVSAGIDTLDFGAVSAGAVTAVPMFTPATLDEGSSLSHWAGTLAPEELMEPNTPQLGVRLLSALDIGSMLDMAWPLRDADQDGDGLSNEWEVLNGTNPRVADADQDGDGDTLSNAQELGFGTAANRADSDGDQIDDATELHRYNTDPIKADTDGDGVPDNLERYSSGGAAGL
ncbi:hypothetical protein FKG94_27200 [Exilibacterium tricleocarpae]|uniref:Peptidase n=1 Tax=Exilibacterium tricleocarpae TaxID=2591008 RepID=A0A545SMU5_9GAMM|nr:thrombospondin type 3 repeat-containing protein [Exilibacterium tricleocarpae]TQV66285.1 hypothetical protein FKG94_27200 [Exilibacterium tricleocarpae]